MKLVRQVPGSKVCLIACVAMITNRTIDELIQEFGCLYSLQYHAYWDMDKANLALATYRWAGSFFLTDEPFTEPFYVDLSGAVGLVSVESESLTLSDGSKALHCVVFDPEIGKFLDPNYDEPRDPKDYKICDWTPYTRLDLYQGPEL